MAKVNPNDGNETNSDIFSWNIFKFEDHQINHYINQEQKGVKNGSLWNTGQNIAYILITGK